MTRYRPKKKARIHSTRRMKKSVDQIKDEMEKMESRGQTKIKRPKDADLPGMGQFYCMACDRYFIHKEAMQDHLESRPHKKRLIRLKEEQHDYHQPIDTGLAPKPADVKMD